MGWRPAQAETRTAKSTGQTAERSIGGAAIRARRQGGDAHERWSRRPTDGQAHRRGRRPPPPAGPCRATGGTASGHGPGPATRHPRLRRKARRAAAGGRTRPTRRPSRGGAAATAHGRPTPRRLQRLARDAISSFQRDAVVGRRDRTREGRPAQPHVGEVHEAPAGRDMRLERLAHVPSRTPFRQEHVDELRLGGHADRERRTERQPRPGWVTGSGDRRQPGRLDRRAPRVGDVALGQRPCLRTAPDDQPPALPWLGGHRTRRRGIGVHVC